MATIKDIARAAGVTATTVSNVLHDRTQHVSPDTVKRVRQIIDQMGYVPNMSARALVGSASRIIAVVSSLVPLSSGGFFQDPFHAVLLSGIEQTVRANGYYLMVRTVESTDELHSLQQNWNIDGMILTGAFSPRFYRQLEATGTPCVQIDSSAQSLGLRVGLEDRYGGYLATLHLLENGHRDILFCCPPMKDSAVIERRYEGYCDALGKWGVPAREDMICESDFSSAEGIALGKRLAARRDYTAIFATADILAAEICTGLMLSGRSVPNDVSIIGFDDIAVSRINCPPLTTIHQDVAARGTKAVEMLVDAIQTGHRADPYIFGVSLVKRESVRNLNL